LTPKEGSTIDWREKKEKEGRSMKKEHITWGRHPTSALHSERAVAQL